MIGLSVSRCCAEMAQGKVSPASVEKIVSRTACETDQHWESVMNQYCDDDWDPSYVAEARRIATDFWRAGLVEQPRLKNNTMPDIHKTGIWVDSYDQIVFILG